MRVSNFKCEKGCEFPECPQGELVFPHLHPPECREGMGSWQIDKDCEVVKITAAKMQI